MTTVTTRYRDGRSETIDYGRPWPPPESPWHEQAPEFTQGSIHWLRRPEDDTWELLEASPRVVVWVSQFVEWFVDKRATSEDPRIVRLADNFGCTVVYRLVHHEVRHGGYKDQAMWLEWVD